jgi:hypothetical protein
LPFLSTAVYIKKDYDFEELRAATTINQDSDEPVSDADYLVVSLAFVPWKCSFSTFQLTMKLLVANRKYASGRSGNVEMGVSNRKQLLVSNDISTYGCR